MSRSGWYEDDAYDEGADWRYIRWRGALTSTLRGRRGQAFLREMLAALDALPEKRLIARNLVDMGGDFCALGAVGRARGVPMEPVSTGKEDCDYDMSDAMAGLFDIPITLASAIMDQNDDAVSHAETPEQRFIRFHRWVERQLIEWDIPQK